MTASGVDTHADIARGSDDYVIRLHTGMHSIEAGPWNELLQRQATPTPFMRHEYLDALERSGSVAPETGWTPLHLTISTSGAPEALAAACPVYAKMHSWGEYVFDWAWADAHERHGMAYYPKLLVAVPFTPVPGSRLLATDALARRRLVAALLALARSGLDNRAFSSMHVLFGDEADQAACRDANLLMRDGVQFHWHNRHPHDARVFTTFDDFLGALSQEKRKKIRQERQKVARAGVVHRVASGPAITSTDWAFFMRCYAQTYREHGHSAYLNQAFFDQLAAQQPGHWVMFIAERNGNPIASSLIAINQDLTSVTAGNYPNPGPLTAYGRYWGALERVDCLHFETCYYQPLQWCIEHGIAAFEGGAQGEHKMARALLPVATASAHWLAHPAFASAVGDFLKRESRGMAHYLHEREAHNPFKAGPARPPEPPVA